MCIRLSLNKSGITLIELSLAVLILSVGMVTILGVYVGQVLMNEHSRNLSSATRDASRIVEEIRRQNSGAGCITPTASMAGGWDSWIETQNQGKGIMSSNPNVDELIVVTCRDETGASYCASTQVAVEEWQVAAGSTAYDPIQVNVSVCWRHRARTVGECVWDGAALVPTDGVTGTVGVIESPVMLTTFVTCHN